MVLDDLSDPADLEGLWPAGPAGKVLITTADAAGLPADRRKLVFPVGVFSPREALSDATALLRDTAARCERVLPRGDRLTRSVQESLTNIAGG